MSFNKLKADLLINAEQSTTINKLHPSANADLETHYDLENLPFDIVYIIAYYLNPQELLALFRVSSSINTAIKQTKEFNKNIKKEVLIQNCEGEELSSILTFLSKYDHWQKFIIEKCSISETQMETIYELISNCQALPFVKLSNNLIQPSNNQFIKINQQKLTAKNLGKHALDEILNILSKNNNWKEIVLSNCLLTNTHLTIISTIINSCKSLTHLDLSKNNLNQNKIKIIAQALKKSKSITYLDLKENNFYSSKPRTIVGLVIAHKHEPRNLDVGCCKLSLGKKLSSNKKEKMMIFNENKTSIAINSLSNNKDVTVSKEEETPLNLTNLSKVSIYSMFNSFNPYNNITVVLEIIKDNCSIQTLDLSDNNLDAYDLRLISQALEKNSASCLTTIRTYSKFISRNQKYCDELLRQIDIQLGQGIWNYDINSDDLRSCSDLEQESNSDNLNKNC